jgi:hypothetical protein
MKRLWVAAALAPLSFAAMIAPSKAHADTTISSGTTTPLSTTSSGNISITSGGSISPTVGPAAVTVNSNGNVTNAGTLSYSGVGNTSAILVSVGSGNITSTIVNSGTITNNETTTGQGTNQSITNGPFANGVNRFGIQIGNVGDTGVFNGSITNTGSITIIGEKSAAIAINSAMDGDLVTTGTITVTGGSTGTTGGQSGNVSFGVNAVGLITGNVNIGGTVAANGQNATGVALSGGVSGGVVVDGAITTTGFRSTTAPTDPAVLSALTPDQILQGGSALVIGGNVTGGVDLDAAVAATGNVSAVTEGTLTTIGSAPALLIGGNSAITLGADGVGDSLTIGGAVTATGAYPAPGNTSAPFSATGIQIGGSNPLGVTSSNVEPGSAFGNVTLTNGITVSGTVTAASEAHLPGLGDATGILIGKGGSVSSLTNSGDILASTESDAPAVGNATYTYAKGSVVDVTGKIFEPVTVTAIQVQAGGSLTTINNSGVISAAITGIPTATNYAAAGGINGQAIAIYDASGSVRQVTNTNTIGASITPIVFGQSVGADSNIIAMYLANTAGNVTVTQSANGNTSITPSITGAVILGQFGGNATGSGNGAATGSENINVEAGSLTGAVAFNGVGNNSLTVGGNATVTGALSQAAGGSLAINVTSGLLDITSPVTNTYGGNTTASIPVSTLHIGKGGQIIFTINPNQANLVTGQFDVAGAATLDQGSAIGAGFTSKLTATNANPTGTETYTLIHAGSLSGNATSTSLLGSLPYLYQGNITTTATDVDLTVSIKSAKQLGFNAAQGSAYAAIYSQMSTDTAVEADVLSQTSRAGLFQIYNQFLPDYAGGPFEAIVSAQGAIERAQADAPIKLQTDETRGWVQEIGFVANRQSNAVANGYQAKGFGFVAGAEQAHGDSVIGVSGAFVTTGVDNATQVKDASLSTLAIEGGVYWREGGEGLNANANINGGYVSMGSHRLLLDQTSAGAVSLVRDAESQWSGAVGSAQFGVAYQITAGWFFMRPELSLDYIALYESAHTETGGGKALNLSINSRLSKEAAAQADLVLGWNLGDAIRWRPEMTVGWRQIIAGGPDSTTAKFLSGGQSFTLAPDLSDRGGLLARLGVRAGGSYTDISADAGGEFRNGYQTYDARAVARFLF